MRFTPRKRRAWREWLEKHHATRSEIWVVFYKRQSGKPTLTYNDAVEEALCFGWIDGVKRSIDEDRYEHRFSPRKADSNWSASNLERVERLLEADLMTPAGQRAIDEAKRNGKWIAHRPPAVDWDLPPELAARLERNEKAAVFFQSLAPSYQRQFIGWIAAAKRADTRQRRVDEAITRLEAGEKLGMR